MYDFKREIEKILLKYMDYSDENTAFEDGYIPDNFEPSILRDELVQLFEKVCKDGEIHV